MGYAGKTVFFSMIPTNSKVMDYAGKTVYFSKISNKIISWERTWRVEVCMALLKSLYS